MHNLGNTKEGDVESHLRRPTQASTRKATNTASHRPDHYEGCRDYYGYYGWMTLEEAKAVFNSILDDYFAHNQVKYRHTAPRNRFTHLAPTKKQPV